MVEYIEREALAAWLKRIPLKDLSEGRGLCRVIMEEDFKHAIRTLPDGVIADVAPVRHGQWIEDGDCQVCSECGEEHCWDEYRAAYCDSCGAKMDGKGGDA